MTALQQRVLTAAVLLALLLGALLYPHGWVFASVTLVLIAAAAWEWFRLNSATPYMAYVAGAICAMVCGALWTAGAHSIPLPGLWIGATAAWCLAGAVLLYRGVPLWAQIPAALRQIGGLLVLVCAWLAVIQAKERGTAFLLSALALAWVADTGAYFVGRAWGGRWFRTRLAPSISPGKTWEGFCGGLAVAFLLAYGWWAADTALASTTPSLYTIVGQHSPLLLVVVVPALTAWSVVGDLLESLVKRSANVKDSSALLPGHGGVLDRIDALLPTLPASMFLVHVCAN
ncbi:phosphatidate cytidylyltransferase [Candidatus Symbiobacter mobilis]|uniref:Phosphatidate cytidylyltransferase n=1 Tax=Candidatus Symbiobacter mobilis CR TaxID=946483 RepID=U5N4B6_9BURK|nr:phosphatidate cytidylyltransferase [Candidatus Symbiobacter mobilis]AGX86167.1 phosphatidate cytidylyltransferase [Candidatus Symbiobacter mobilis CR]